MYSKPLPLKYFKWVLCLMLAFFFIGSCTSFGKRSSGTTDPLRMERGSRIAVLWVSKDFTAPGWEDVRIGWSLADYLTEALFETRLFALAEIKPEVLAELRGIRELAWNDGSAKALAGSDIPEKIETRFLASGKVVSVGSPRSGFTFGLFHARSRMTVVEVEVTILDSLDGTSISASGRGSAERSSTSAVFDLRGKEVLLDQSTIGLATQKAIREAVKALVRRIDIKD